MNWEVKIAPYSHPRCPWRVWFPTRSGKRDAKAFKDKGLAETFAQKKEAEIARWGVNGTLTESERIEALRAIAILSESDFSLSEAAEFCVQEKKRRAESISFADAIEKFLATKRAAQKSRRYLNDLDSRVGGFKKFVCKKEGENLSIAEVGQSIVEEWLTEKKAPFRNRRGTISCGIPLRSSILR